MVKTIDPREKNLSPDRLRRIRRIEELARKIKNSWITEKYFND